jgi:hypothetical protein
MNGLTSTRTSLRLALAFITALTLSTHALASDFKANLNIQKRATALDTGLPHYPEAVALPGRKDDSDSGKLQFSAGDYGLKVAAVKLRSHDSREKIAAFYERELARFGTVLDCTDGDASQKRERDRKSRELSCDGQRAKRNAVLFKAGSRTDQRVVSIEQKGEVSLITLVHVEIRGLD